MTTLKIREKRKVCTVLVDRANYGRLKPVMHAIKHHPELSLQTIAAGTMPLERFGQAVNIVREDGFTIDGEIYTELEGSTPSTMAKSVGFGLVEFASEFQRLKPDVVLIIGDRYEALAATLAAAYMNICIVHVQGGEVSGSIDESARHAITKFAHYHYPSTNRSAEYIIRMGEPPESILGIGCPSSDIAKDIDKEFPFDIINSKGSGCTIDSNSDYLLVLFHPTTTEFGGERHQMEQLLCALNEVKKYTLLLWPNIDAGSDHVSKAIRVFRDQKKPDWIRSITNLPPIEYLKILSNASCAIGNSSSFVRDASYFGTPVVLVGNRQNGREIDNHVTKVKPHKDEIFNAIQSQLVHGRYDASLLYGDGNVSPNVADKIAKLKPFVQKRLNYIYET